MYSKNQTYSISPIRKIDELITNRQFEQALNLLVSLKLPPRTKDLYMRYVQCQYELKQYPKVISYMKNKEITPNKAFLFTARSYAAMGNHEEAIRIFIHFPTGSLNKEEFFDLVKCYEALGQYNNAIKAYRNFYFSNMDINILIQLTQFCEKIGNIQSATESYQLMLQQGFKPFTNYCNKPLQELNTKNDNQVEVLKPLQQATFSANKQESSYLAALLSYPKNKLSLNAKEFIPSKATLKDYQKEKLSAKPQKLNFLNDTISAPCKKNKLSSKATSKQKSNPNSFFKYYNANIDKGVSAYTEQCALLFCDTNKEMLNYLKKHQKERPDIEALNLSTLSLK